MATTTPRPISCSPSGEAPVLVLTLNRPERLNAWTDALEEQLLRPARRGGGRPGRPGDRRDGRRAGLLRRRRHERPRAGRHERRRGGRVAARPPAAADVPADRPQADDRGDQRRGRGPGPRRGAVLRHPLRDAGGEAHDGVRPARAGRRVRHLLAAAATGRARAARWTCCCRVASSAARRRCGSGWSTASASPTGSSTRRWPTPQELAAHSSPWSMATIKAQVQADLDRSFADAVAAADELMLASFDRPDVEEGVRSYLEGRPPAFPSLDPRSQST